ncbi:serine/threonine-protein kinase [Nannocystis pusilla]|uniref:serine/threonine-protein kinase n=1 Tax=Nannocystis pusilla TaxID=889268 RepID=UPI0021E129F7|nr:serine/threonine-protein kinase [Nannocystis pusilla]
MKLPAKVQAPPEQPRTEVGLPRAPGERVRETMAVAIQFANTAILPDLALSPTMSTPPEEGGMERTGPQPPPATALAGQVGPYRILRPLGAGGMGAVYEGTDTRTGQRVAVKSLLRMGPSELHRFKYEFRSMAEVGHPNLVTLYELHSQGDLWLITMEYVGGVDLCTALRALVRAPDSDRRLRALIRQLVLGVTALHEHGLLHRDLKPSNVLVTSGGRVVILDFGLVAAIARSNPNETPAGTPLYMSPEQCAGQLATPASDWYAVGVMLYEALTGKLPFTGNYAQIFLAKQCEEPAPPRGTGLPDDLAALIGELLRRDPEKRASGAKLLAWCGGAALSPAPALSSSSILFGRKAELDALDEGLAAAARGRTACVYLRGQPGVGKTGLVHGFLGALQPRGDVVALTARCYQHETVPFKAFDSLVDALADHLGALEPFELTPLLGTHTGELARVFPVLQRVSAVRELAQSARAGVSDQESRRKAFAALKRLLAALAARRRLVLFLDDFHWSDADSVRLLSELLAPPDAPALLLIVAYHTDWPGSPLVRHEFERLQLRVLPELHVTRLDVGRLDERDAHAAARALLVAAGLPPEPWAAAIADEARGDSYVLEALVHELTHADLASLVPEDLSFETCLQARVDNLAPGDRAALELVAAAGAPLPTGLLARALGDPSDIHARLARLHAARLVQLGRRNHAPSVEPLHDRGRALVVRALSPDRARALHRLLADTALQLGRPDPEFMARHLFAAGDRERAATYAERAGKAAADALAFARAAELHELALRCTPDAWPRMVACARAKVDAGLGLEAAPIYLKAAERAPVNQRAELRVRACEQYFAVGETARGEEVLKDLLQGTGFSDPGTREVLAAAFQSEVAALLGGADPDMTERTGSEGAALSDALWAAAKGLFIHSPVRSAYFSARSAAIARAGGDEPRHVRGMVIVRAVWSVAGDPAVLARLRGVIDDYLRRRDDPYIVGLSVLFDGISAVTVGRWSDAMRDIEFGITHLRQRCTNIAWECNFGAVMLMSLLESRGELRAIALRSAVMAEQAQQTGDSIVEFVAAYYTALVLLAADAPSDAREVVARAVRLGNVAAGSAAGLRASMIEALCRLYAGEVATAWAEVEPVPPVLGGGGVAFTKNQRANFISLHGQVALAMAERSATGDAREPYLAAAAADADALRQIATAGAVASAALLDAAALALRDAPADVVAPALSAAADAFDAADMPLAAAAARLRLGTWIGGCEGEQMIARSEAFMRLQAIACPARWVITYTPGLSPPV